MRIFTVDAFTDKPFAGNPAGVCVLGRPAEEEWMQKVANEMNLSETAFLYPHKEGYQLRWFTPEKEVKLCGHATLATAHILWEEKFMALDKKIIFYTLSGDLAASKSGSEIELDFPAIVCSKVKTPEEIKQSLGIEVINTAYNSSGYWIVEVKDEKVVRSVVPNYNTLEKNEGLIIVTGKSLDDKHDFVSRVFAPSYGINEDPVTGAAHCCLTPYWSAKLNKNNLLAYQASKRGGFLKLKLDNDRVKLIGQAVTVIRAEVLF